MVDEEADPGPRQGLSWSWELDFDTLLRILNEPAPWSQPQGTASPAAGSSSASSPTAAGDSLVPLGPADSTGSTGSTDDDDREALEEAIAAGRAREVPLGEVAGRVAEALPPGPDLAGWLAATNPRELDDGALAGVAASFRRLVAWAQARELATVAEIASRSAAADPKLQVDEAGRPSRLSDDAVAQVCLAMAMTRYSASWWTDLAVTLSWRLAATGEAMSAGQLDLGRARLIAEATAVLDDDTARAVEAAVLPRAGDLTTSQLRTRLRRAVIAADPDGADRRRKDAERRAQVCLYPDEEGTATLAGQRLPGISAAAAMARITALARARKAAGVDGGMDLQRAEVYVGLLLGTLPYIPPAPGAAPDDPPPDDAPPAEPPPAAGPPPNRPPSGEPPTGGPRSSRPRSGGSPSGQPTPGARPGGGHDTQRPGRPESEPERPGAEQLHQGENPAPSDADAPSDEFAGDPLGGDPDWAQPWSRPDEVGDDDWFPGQVAPNPAWPGLPSLPPLPALDARQRPPPGTLDLTVPWATLAGRAPEAGHLGRLGPITPAQARQIADAAAGDPAVPWRIIVTTSEGCAVAVTRVPASRSRAASARSRPRSASKPGFQEPRAGGARPHLDDPCPGAGLVGRVTLTISVDQLSDDQLCDGRRPDDRPGASPDAQLPGGDILARALRAARRAVADAADCAAADAASLGGCAHAAAAPGYRPPPRLRDYVVARDETCRFPSCGQPAWRGDLDHTHPYHRGGLTCSCNLGGLCRHHHQLKQHLAWALAQIKPGVFQWTTSAGRVYTATPAAHPV